jgi:TetR/AcrR family transcriptional regulator, fatty acid biosynthesis regulator
MAKLKPQKNEKVIPNKERREATRLKLIHAAITLLREEGIAALSTVNITKKAGIAQSGFYMHFEDLDDCKKVAAEAIAKDFRDYVNEHRRQMHETDPDDLVLMKKHYEEILSIWKNERHLVEIFLRYRRDFSPLGEVMKNLSNQFRSDLAEDLQNILALKGIENIKTSRIKILADLIIGNISTVGEAIIEDEITDLPEAAEILAVNTQQIFYAILVQKPIVQLS